MTLTPLFLGGLGGPEVVIVMFLGVILFGNRLPEVGRSLGRSLMEFKKGMKGFQDEMDSAEHQARDMIEGQGAESRPAHPHDAAAEPKAAHPGPILDAEPSSPADSSKAP